MRLKWLLLLLGVPWSGCVDVQRSAEPGRDVKEQPAECAKASDCDDGLTCTLDRCVGGQCLNDRPHRTCDVDSDCFPDGASAPGDSCLVCDPDRDGQGWSALACDDGDPCTSDDACTPGGGCAGVARDCADAGDGACTIGDCDPSTGGCVAVATFDGATCDDGDACTDADACRSGVCTGQPRVCPDSGDPCETSTCEGGSCVARVVVGAECQTGNDCLEGGRCSVHGLCVGAWACPCDSDAACAEGAPECTVPRCADGQCAFDVRPSACLIDGVCRTFGEERPGDACARCQPTVSQSGWSAARCEDGNPCTVDGCDPDGAGCVFEAEEDGEPCDDGRPQTHQTTCQAGACVGNEGCVTDADCAALPATETCSRPVCLGFHCVVLPDPAHEGAACDDGQLCTANDTCRAGACVGQVRVCEGTACVVAACDPATGECTKEPGPAGTPCDDGDTCTLTDACSDDGQCSGAPVDCAAFEGPCVQAACFAGSCQLSYAPAGEACNDDDACTTADACDQGVCSGSWDKGACPCSSDADCPSMEAVGACALSTCVAGACATQVKPGRCLIDGACYEAGATAAMDACRQCRPELGARLWHPTPCDDGNSCTYDACSADAGCVHTASLGGAPCDDGDACSHDDACSSGICVGSCECREDSDCGDAAPSCQRVVCIANACVAIADPLQDGQICDDGAYCSVEDVCSSGTCLPGAPRDCAAATDGPCTFGACAEPLAACVAMPLPPGTFCDDHDACTDSDRCDAAAVCRGTPRACPGIEGPCVESACVDGACLVSATPFGIPCDDGAACTEKDRCHGSGRCTGTWGAQIPGCGCASDADCASLDGACQVGRCDVASQTCVVDLAPAWAPCDDGAACTQADRCGAAGVCAGTPYDCADGVPCSDDRCDGAGGCDHPVAVGACLVEGACVSEGAAAPGASCLRCDPAEDPHAWSPGGGDVLCDDGDPCTSGDACDGLLCVGSVRVDCDDGLACTDDACDGAGGCTVAVQPGWCVVDGLCVPGGAPAPTNACHRCAPDVDPDGWTSVGGGCDDGDPCTRDDTCQAGVCAGAAFSCDDGRACTTDVCQGSGKCEHIANAAGCFIDGVCLADGTPHPANACLVCISVKNATDWMPLPPGVACSAGPGCSASSVCDGSGACVGNGICDATECVEVACSGPGSCSIMLRPGRCRILGGPCLIDGDVDPTNPCRGCDADASQFAWSDRDGAPCDDGDPTTIDDRCAAGSCEPGLLPTCPEVLPCETVTPNPDGSCSVSRDAGWCVVAGVCVEAGGSPADNPCAVCDPFANPGGWTPVAGPCPDDGLPCTRDLCVGGHCVHARLVGQGHSGQCLIDGACWDPGAASPDNPCLTCLPDQTPVAWVAAPPGTPCTDDGKPCTDDVCGMGVCAHVPLAARASCDDGDALTGPDWCVGATCVGWEYTLRGQPLVGFLAASPSAAGGVHALYGGGDGIAVERFDGTGPPMAAATLAVGHGAVAEHFAVAGEQLFWWSPAQGAWTDDTELSASWGELSTSGERFGALLEVPGDQPGSTLLAVPILRSGLPPRVRSCSGSCGDELILSAAPLNTCIGMHDIGSRRFVSCQATHSDTAANTVVAFVEQGDAYVPWALQPLAEGGELLAAGTAGDYLVWTGSAGTLGVAGVAADGGVGVRDLVAVEGYAGPETKLTAVTAHGGRVWVFADADPAGSTGHDMALLSAPLDAPLEQPQSWRVDRWKTDPPPIGPFASIDVLVGDDAGLYLLGSWKPQSSPGGRVVWFWPYLSAFD